MASGRGIQIQDKDGADGINVPAMSVNFNVNRNQITEESFSIATQSKIYAGNYSVTGSFSAAYRPTIFADITKYVLGNAAVADGIDVNGFDQTNDYASITIQDDNDNYYSFASIVINSMELTLNSNEFAKVTYNWIGIQKGTTNAAIESPDFSEDIPLFYNAILSKSDPTVETSEQNIKFVRTGGNNPTSGGFKAKAVTIKIDRPMTPDYILGTEYAYTMVQSGQMTVSGTLTFSPSEYEMLEKAMITDDEGNGHIEPNAKNKNEWGAYKIILALNKSNGSGALEVITIDKALITSMDTSAQGANVFDKKVDWVAQIKSADTAQIKDADS